MLSEPERLRKYAEYQRRWRERNPELSRKRALEQIQKRKEYIRKAKENPCTDCGCRYPYYVMQFDHCRGKKKFGLATGTYRGIKSIAAEIAKCDLVCANCHMVRTAERGGWANE